MTASMQPQEWLRFIEEEYLDSFVKQGGSAIKFAIPLEDDVRSVLTEGLSRLAESLGYLAACVSAENTRIHMVDQIFFRIAEHVPWQRLSQQVIAKLAHEQGYKPAGSGDDPLYVRMADANGVAPDLLRINLRREISEKVFSNRELAKDFRVAMTQLCWAELSGGPAGEIAAQVMTDWLTGRNQAVSAVKPYQIFSRISRTNARYMFESLLRWVAFAGRAGMLISLDIARVTLARNPRDGQNYYTKAAVLDAYEVLRQFIDGTDQLRGCLIVVLPDRTFLDTDVLGRGIGSYQALMFRVFDEVHDQQLVNPMASLVRLAAAAVEGAI